MIDLTKNIGEAVEKTAEAQARCEKALGEGMEKALLVIEADARRGCPVEDGRLRASIGHEVTVTHEEARGRVGTNVDYAPYVHEGTGIYAAKGDGRQTPWVFKHPKTGEFVLTRGIRPRPFLRDAMDKNKGRIAEIFREAVNSLK